MRFAITLAALLAVTTPSLALGEADAWQRQMDIQRQMPQTPQMPQWASPSQPPSTGSGWSAPPAQYLQPPARLQTTCYLIGNIMECY
jgi:hypothetical protein